MQYNNFFVSVFLGLFVFSISGCGNSDGRYTRVEGTITYNGEAVEGATVTFVPTAPDGESASGLTDSSGNYTLTSAYAEAGGRGALPGDYQVTVSKREATVSNPDQEAFDRGEITYEEFEQRSSRRDSYAASARPRELLPEKYGQPHTSELKATVTTGRVSAHHFELTD